METLIEEANMTILDLEAAKRMVTNTQPSGIRCSHKHEYWTGVEKDVSYILFSVHFYEYTCPDCNKSYWLVWKPDAVTE